jgi:eukaryotic-like serine/threonine-protein kinase
VDDARDDNPGPTLSEVPRGPRSARASADTRQRPDTDSVLSRPRENPRTVTYTSNTDMTARAAEEATGVSRLRAMAVIMVALSLLGLACTTVLRASHVVKVTAWSSLSLLALMFSYMLFGIEREGALSKKLVARATVPLSLCVVAAQFSFGMFSAFAAAVALGLLLFSSSIRRRDALLAYGTIAGGYAVTSLLQHLGYLAYESLFQHTFRVWWHELAGQVAVEGLYAAAYVAGRMIRREQARVVEQFERAVRETSMRDALLREARDALRNAQGIGVPGRFSDQELAGFRLGNVIGRGGMGEVYEASRLEGGERAAVKLLRLDALSERSAMSRFEREARIVASVRSPHVVRVLSVSDPSSVFPYIAMELLDGSDLSSYLRDHGRLPLAEVVELVEQIAFGLDAAHSVKVVHRDLKPNNIFRTVESGRVLWKILDFGVSKLMDHDGATLTLAELVGTPQYMAPEQARGDHNLDQRADVYALTAIAFRAICGEPPFTGQMPGILRKITDEMPRPPSLYGDMPRDVDFAIRIGLAKRKDDRYTRASEFAHALRAASLGRLDEQLRQLARALLDTQPYGS